MTQGQLEKAIAIQDEMKTYSAIAGYANEEIVFLAGQEVTHYTVLPEDLKQRIRGFCNGRVKELQMEFERL